MISIYQISDVEKWDEIVKSFKNHDVYYLSDYVKAFEIHGDGEPILLYYQGHGLKAINVVMKRDISIEKGFEEKVPADTYYDLATPYGYGGFLIEGEATENNLNHMQEEYRSFCKRKGVVSEFVRFHPVLNNYKMVEGIYDVSKHGNTVTINLDNQKQVWDDLSSKNRNHIRKAKKNGVEIFWGRDPDLKEKFMDLYKATMDKENAEDYYYFKNDFYHSVLNDLKYNSMIFYAVYEEKIIAMSIILFSNYQMHYHLSASDKNYLYLAPTNLLIYEAACWGCENRYQTFHLGGGLGSQEDDLFIFKKAFNKKSETYFSSGRKIINEEKYKELMEIRQEISQCNLKTEFFPQYRVSN